MSGAFADGRVCARCSTRGSAVLAISTTSAQVLDSPAVAKQDLRPASWPRADDGVRRIITGFRSHGPVAFRPVTPEPHRSDTPMMPLGQRRCCPAYVHSGTETRTRPIGVFPTRRRACPAARRGRRRCREHDLEQEHVPRNVPGMSSADPGPLTQAARPGTPVARGGPARDHERLSAVLTRGRGIAWAYSLGDESSATRSGRSE